MWRIIHSWLSPAILILFSVLTVGLGDRASAQAPSENPLHGIWEIAIEPAVCRTNVSPACVTSEKAPPRFIAYLSFSCPIGSSRGRVFSADGSFLDHIMSMSYENGVLKWSGYEMRFSSDGHKATGTWFNGSEKFRSMWRRVIPQIDRVRTISQTKDTVRLEVSGRKLFYFDPAYVPLCGAISVEGIGMIVTGKTPTPGKQLVTVDIAVTPGTPAGRRFLYFGGARIPWDWQGNVSLPPKVSDLRFVRQVDQRFEPVKDDLKYGEPFFVEARFEAESSEAPKTVRLEWGTEQSQEIAVKRTSDAKIFRSETLYLEPPASAEKPARR